MKKRASGILMPISALPGRYGIGDFGRKAYQFVDFLSKSNQHYWQILPMVMTGPGNSPYQSVSAFAGNPLYINLDEHASYLDDTWHRTDYDRAWEIKDKLLRSLFIEKRKEWEEEMTLFYKKEQSWLRPFSLFLSIKAHMKNRPWQTWPEKYKDINSSQVQNFEQSNQDEIKYWHFTQYLFYSQWKELKRYANDRGVKIMGDLPIYVADDSADVWASPQLFKLDSNGHPLFKAGVPPDAFSKEGQLWGNPVYNWNIMEERGYDWWKKRIEHSFKLVDSLRLDHFRGFESYWEIEYDAKDATTGQWVKGPGMKLFDALKDELGDLDIIAEDLGLITDEVQELIKETGFPGMRVLQFAFDDNMANPHLPHNHEKNDVVYTGTHDNNTIMGWWENLSTHRRMDVREYFKLNKDEGINWGMIRGAWSSPAYLSIAQMQDFLCLGSEARMNIPATPKGNWTWRLEHSLLTDQLAEKISVLTKQYGR